MLPRKHSCYPKRIWYGLLNKFTMEYSVCLVQLRCVDCVVVVNCHRFVRFSEVNKDLQYLVQLSRENVDSLI